MTTAHVDGRSWRPPPWTVETWLAWLLLALYPTTFKIQVRDRLVVHPCELLLAAVGIALVVRGIRRLRGGRTLFPDTGRTLWIPIAGFVLLAGLLELSLALWGLRGGAPRLHDVLLPAKSVLYLLALPLFGWQAREHGRRFVVPALGLLMAAGLTTLAYSAHWMGPGLFSIVTPAGIERPTGQVQGFLGQALTLSGDLVFRRDTVAHGAYAEYLTTILVAAVVLWGMGRGPALLRWSCGLVALLAPLGILETGSRASLIYVVAGLGIVALLLARSACRRRVGLLLTVCGAVLLWGTIGPGAPRTPVGFKTLGLMPPEESLSADAPDVDGPDAQTTSASVSAAQARFSRMSVVKRREIARRSLDYVTAHPWVLLVGVGYSRESFLHTVARPETGPSDSLILQREWQTPHNLYLDVLVKAGLPALGALVATLGSLGLLLWLAAIRRRPSPEHRSDEDALAQALAVAALGVLGGLALLSVFQEELLVDILLLHLLALAGMALGLDRRVVVHAADDSDGPVQVVQLLASGGGAGGGQRHVSDLVAGLPALGVGSWLVAPAQESLPSTLSEAGSRRWALPLDRFNPLHALRVAVAMSREGAGVLHAHGFGAGIYGSLISSLVPARTLHTPHGSGHLAKNGWRRRLDIVIRRWTELFTDRVLFVSEGERQSFADVGAFRSVEGRIVVNGIPDAQLRVPSEAEKRTAREALGLPAEGVTVGVVARLHNHKNIPLLLEALALVAPSTLAGVRVLGGGPDEAELRRRVGELGLTERVVLCGAVPDARQLVPAFDLMASASRSEGLPYALIEGMGQGVPVVVTDVAGHRDVVGLGGGILVPNYDPAALAAQITRLASDPALRSTLSTEALEVTRRYFGLSQQLESIRSAYRDPVSSNG